MKENNENFERIKKLMEKSLNNKKYFSLNDEIDNIKNLSLFQKVFIKDIHYFVFNKGKFAFIQNYVINKYQDILNKDELIDEIDELIELGYINVKLEKTIYINKFVTNKLMTLNYELLNLHPENYID